MKPFALTCVCLMLVAGCRHETAPPPSTSQQAYLDEALDLIQKHALNSHRVDWPQVRHDATVLAATTTEPAQTHDFLRGVLGQLGDNHSLLLSAADHDRLKAPPGKGTSPRATSRSLSGGLAYVSVPTFMSGNVEAGIAFASDLRDRIAALDAIGTCGWVVDLRGNGGGNMYPMLAGLGPLLGDGDAGRFVAPGKPDVSWWYRDTSAGTGDTELIAPGTDALRLKISPATVAVLTGPGTASSGEAIAISFRGRPLARSFGGYTMGLSSGNVSLPLDDGALIALTTTLMADRNGQVYGGRIRPDEVVPARLDSGDHALDAAMAWLSVQPACSSHGVQAVSRQRSAP